MIELQREIVELDSEMKMRGHGVSKAIKETIDLQGLEKEIYGKVHKFTQLKIESLSIDKREVSVPVINLFKQVWQE